MNTKRILAVILASVMLFCMIPFSASAASAEVLEIDGERTAFVSAFGRISYNGKSYTSFKNFNDAFAALGKAGGKIVFTGTMQLGDFKDVDGRGPVTIEGIGTIPTGNLLAFTGSADAPVTEVNLKGDLNLVFCTIRMNNGAYLYTNGHNFVTSGGFDTYSSVKYVADGDDIITYVDPPSVAPGSADADGVIEISKGTFETLAAGSVNGKNVTGDTYVALAGGTVNTAVAGNVGNGTMTGNANLDIDSGIITKLVAGSSGGTINGDVTTTIGGGEITDVVIGAETGATINGNVIVALNGGKFTNKLQRGKGKVTGKVVVIAGADATVAVDSSIADYIIKIDGGRANVQDDGSFLITDLYGIPQKSVVINGSTATSENGIYKLSNGISEIKVTSSVKVAINKNASYVAGRGEGIFDPQANMTRAEAITLLARLLTDESIIKGYVKADYNDVAEDAWYTHTIGFLQGLGFLDTIEEKHGSSINPTAQITRAEFVELIYKLTQFGGDSPDAIKLANFTDVSGDGKYATAINFAVGKGIVNGYEDGTFKPDNNITRAEVVTVVNRFLGRIPNGGEGKTNFNDITNHWAKTQILAACNAEGETWTAGTANDGKYELKGTTAKDYVVGLYEASANLSGDAIREGVSVISEQMKKDILSTGNTLDIYKEEITGKVYYISEKNGNDANDGLSPETAWQSLAALKTMRLIPRNSAVLFERGGVYRGTVSAANNMYYGAYGDTSLPKPLIIQSRKNYADPALWTEVEGYPNVWKLNEQLINVGIVAYDHEFFEFGDYDAKYGDIMNYQSFGFMDIGDFTADLQFYSYLPDMSTGKYGDFYIYSTEGNPGSRFKSIELGEKIDIFDGSPINVTIDNIYMKYTGGHAVGFGSSRGIRVTNCVFSWLGGSVLSYRQPTAAATNYGNAIEVYGNCDDYYVENNWMYQIYDTAVTHQHSDTDSKITMQNVRYFGNLMEYVHWGIEFYNASTHAQSYVKDVYMAYNVSRMGGYGWGSKTRYRTSGARLYCGSTLHKNNTEELTEYNIFDRCAGYLLNLPSTANEVQDKNIYIQSIGLTLGNLRGTVYKTDYTAAALIRDKWGDKNGVVVVIPDKDKAEIY